MDWRQKVDDWKKQQEREAEARRVAESLAADAKARAKASEEMEARLKYLARFHCHIRNCSYFSHEPAYIEEHFSSGGGYGIPEFRSTTKTPDWTKPGDLFTCQRCQKWTCKDHIHEGICQECAEKL